MNAPNTLTLSKPRQRARDGVVFFLEKSYIERCLYVQRYWKVIAYSILSLLVIAPTLIGYLQNPTLGFYFYAACSLSCVIALAFAKPSLHLINRYLPASVNSKGQFFHTLFCLNDDRPVPSPLLQRMENPSLPVAWKKLVGNNETLHVLNCSYGQHNYVLELSNGLSISQDVENGLLQTARFQPVQLTLAALTYLTASCMLLGVLSVNPILAGAAALCLPPAMWWTHKAFLAHRKVNAHRQATILETNYALDALGLRHIK